jgi:hypothetical protein
MEGREEPPHVGKNLAVTSDRNYDDSRTLTSLPVWDLTPFHALRFVAVRAIESLLSTRVTCVSEPTHTCLILSPEGICVVRRPSSAVVTN